MRSIKNLSDKSKRIIVIAGCTVLCAVFVVTIASRFQGYAQGKDSVSSNSISSAVTPVIHSIDSSASSADSATGPAPAATDQSTQNIQSQVTKPETPSESETKNPSQAPKSSGNTTTSSPETQTQSPKNGDKKDGKIYIEGFGLINGKYKLLLEPIVYFTFNGIRVAMTATEAALYDQMLGGGLRSKMASLTHKNLPLAMFLEVADLGYPAWSGNRTDRASDSDIISSLGLGVVRFGAAEQPVEVNTGNYEYRVNTEVITSVTVRGGQADPDRPVSVIFQIGDKPITVNNVYYPDGDSQLVWVRWTTPSTPQSMDIQVDVTGGATSSTGVVHANIVDIPRSDPPNPIANDRNDLYTRTNIPNNTQVTSATWGVWTPYWYSNWVWDSAAGIWRDHGWWQFNYNGYSAILSASMNITPDGKDPTASGKTMKSGYGINESVSTNISTNDSSAVTGAQTAITYFPEFQYKTYWRILDRISGGLNALLEFPQNRYSTYNNRTHFTPVWMPDGSYTPYTYLQDCWTPVGMLSINLTDSVTISGNLWDDWHIAPVFP